MSFWELIFLAAVQGVAEFLPISSSGHLTLMQYYCGMKTVSGAALEVALHAGTFLSVLIFYRSRILSLIQGTLRREPEALAYDMKIILSAIPAGVFYFFCKDFLEQSFDSPLANSICLMITGLVLFSLFFLKSGKEKTGHGFRNACLIGMAQAAAILPGISRSGSTITAASWLGIPRRESAEFSFLMSLPVIGGAILLELKDIFALAGEEGVVSGWSLSAGFAVSALVGIAALYCLQKVLCQGKFWLFGIYCFAAGSLSLLWILCH